MDAGQRLRLSRLFTFLQEASIAHTTLLGMGREKTLDRGLLWIVTLQQVKVDRLPVYDEDVKLLSWPGATMHLYFPRYYRMEDKDGRTLLTGSALWALMDRENRKMVFPEEHGVHIDGETGEGPLPLPAVPKPAREGESQRAVREIRAEYSGEAKLGESMELTYTREGDVFLLSGDRGRKLFRLNLMY